MSYSNYGNLLASWANSVNYSKAEVTQLVGCMNGPTYFMATTGMESTSISLVYRAIVSGATA